MKPYARILRTSAPPDRQEAGNLVNWICSDKGQRPIERSFPRQDLELRKVVHGRSYKCMNLILPSTFPCAPEYRTLFLSQHALSFGK